ncbi:hypothetical protein BJY00DRAFT_313272 [Aspergillus carlsbadensis]|nr:hypothetical protein BJY00DRAFT_313272 [Aspergillus carlsbadensis]
MLRVLVLATLWVWHAVAVLSLPDADFEDLVPVPRHVWDKSLTPSAEGAASVELADHERFVWASSESPSEKSIVVNMVTYSKQHERIIDMDRFSFALDDETSCNVDNFSLRFKHPLIYEAAKTAWNWVNYDDLRSFVIVPSWKGCGDHRSHEPWVVTKVEFDDDASKVVLDAALSTWKKVMNTFVLDFGEAALEGCSDKHDIIPEINNRLALDITSSFPKELFSWEPETRTPHARLKAICNGCGTEGAVVVSGHVEAGRSSTGIEVNKFELSVKPQGVKTHVGVSLAFDGEANFRGSTQQPSREINLVNIPLSGWRIPGVSQFGPSISINAGYTIDYISGSGVFTTGVTASIPDTAIANLDLKAANSGQTFGWKPDIQVNPLALNAQVDSQTRLYIEIVVTVSITVLDDNGFGVDLSLKIPQLTMTTSGGVNAQGFCEPNGSVLGVKADSTVGVNLSLQGWAEVGGHRIVLANVTLVNDPDLFTFPEVCEAFSNPLDG